LRSRAEKVKRTGVVHRAPYIGSRSGGASVEYFLNLWLKKNQRSYVNRHAEDAQAKQEKSRNRVTDRRPNEL
jgi:hypothetical protein